MTKKFKSKTLPANFDIMDQFVSKNKTELTEQVISSIEYAINNDLTDIEVFNFQDTEFIVILNVSNFKENLENIYNYYISTEQYEFCDRVIKLQKILNQENNNEQKKRHKSKNTSRSKNKRRDTNQ
jgi:hypothetical protein